MLAIFSLLRAIWVDALCGCLIFVIGAGLGQSLARSGGLFVVRGVQWWVEHIVLRILGARSWLARFPAILINNALVLAWIVAAGLLTVWLAWAGIIATGVSLGIGIRLLNDSLVGWPALPNPMPPAVRRRGRVGILLNLLELPAIAIALGTAIHAGRDLLTAHQAARLFGVAVLPLLALAAAGEALWIGITLPRTRKEDASGRTAQPDDD